MNPRFSAATVLAGTLAALLLGACTSINTPTSTTPISAEEAVARRATERWQAIIANQWSAAYQYTSPGYRAAVSEGEYQGRTANAAIRREAVEVVGVDCATSDSCEATLRLTYQPIMPGYPRMNTDIRERWLAEDGEWYLHLPL